MKGILVYGIVASSSTTDIVAFCTSHRNEVSGLHCRSFVCGTVLFMKAKTGILCDFKHMVIKGFDAVHLQMGKQALFITDLHFWEFSYPVLVQNSTNSKWPLCSSQSCNVSVSFSSGPHNCSRKLLGTKSNPLCCKTNLSFTSERRQKMDIVCIHLDSHSNTGFKEGSQRIRNSGHNWNVQVT